jgi:hypothetical protein
MKNTFGMSVYSKEYIFPVLFYDRNVLSQINSRKQSTEQNYINKKHSSPDYPTFSYQTFRFIWHAMSERSILSTGIVRDWILLRLHLLTLNNKGRWLLQTYYWSGAGVTLPQRKGRRLRSKYPKPISSKNKLFHLQIYIMLNTIFDCEIFHLMPYCIFFVI